MSDGGIISGFLIILLAGFAGSFHCVAMCGGFACGLCSDPNTSVPKLVTRHLFYNLGRLATYLFIGALAGQFGALIVVAVTQQPSAAVATHGHTMMPITPFFLIGELGILQRVVACVAGLLMLLMALQLLGLYRSSPKSWRAFGGSVFRRCNRFLDAVSPGFCGLGTRGGQRFFTLSAGVCVCGHCCWNRFGHHGSTDYGGVWPGYVSSHAVYGRTGPNREVN